jgi:hypothetical protein
LEEPIDVGRAHLERFSDIGDCGLEIPHIAKQPLGSRENAGPLFGVGIVVKQCHLN